MEDKFRKSEISVIRLEIATKDRDMIEGFLSQKTSHSFMFFEFSLLMWVWLLLYSFVYLNYCSFHLD